MAEAESSDLAAKNSSLFAIWIVPMALLFGLNFTGGIFEPATRVMIAAAIFAWMGAACTLNAMRCRRVHCMVSGPAFLIGAMLLVLIAFDAVDLGRDGPNYAIWGTFAVVALSFVVERIIGKYA